MIRTWTYRADSLAHSVAVREKLLGDSTYMDEVADGNDLFTGPVEDVLAEVVHVVGSGDPGNFTTFISAQCQPGRIVEAMGWAAEIQEESSKLTGLDGVVLHSVFGAFAGVAWITPAPRLSRPHGVRPRSHPGVGRAPFGCRARRLRS